MTDAPGSPVPLQLSALGRHALLAGWHGRAESGDRGFRAMIAGRLVPPPAAHVALPVGDGFRHLMALRLGVAELADRPLELRDSRGAIVAADAGDAARRARESDIDVGALLLEFEGTPRVRLARFLLDLCPSLLRLGADPVFLAHARAGLAELSRRPAPLALRCAVGDDLVLCEGLVRRGLGDRLAAVILDAGGLRRAPHPPEAIAETRPRPGLQRLALMVDRAALAAGASVAILGEAGVAIRRLDAAAAPIAAGAWASDARAADAGALDYAMECLARGAESDETAASLLDELRLLAAPVAPAPRAPVAAGLDAVVATAAGTFIAGWLGDPHGLARTLEVERLGRSAAAPLAGLPRFAHPALPGATAGFVAWLPALIGGAAGAPASVALRLASGTQIALARLPTHVDPAAQRRAILAAAPPGALDRAAIAAVLAPPIAATFAATAAPRRETLDFGAAVADPIATLLAPIGEDSDLLRCRFGLLARDPGLARVELVHVLDRPAERAGVAALLADLAAAYGVAVRLVVVDADDEGTALNAAASGARGPALALLGPDVVPEGPGWLERLLGALGERSGCGLAIGQVLHDDQSLVDAGLDFVDDGDGAPRLRARLAGFPRDFAAATAAGPVPLARLDFAAVARETFDRVGGLAGDYLGRDARDADFAARVRRAGLPILRVPDAVALRLAATPAGSRTRGLDPAVEVDRRLFDSRWRSFLAAPAAAAAAIPMARPKRNRRARARAA